MIFDLEDEHSNEKSKVQVIPVRWDATTSFRPGARHGPGAIFNASKQVELFDLDVRDPWKQGIYWNRTLPNIKADRARWLYEKLKRPTALELDEQFFLWRQELTGLCETMNAIVQVATTEVFDEKQIPIIVGGDHSVAYGAYAAVEEDFSILQIDAHMDLREAYEGHKWSHASVMYNALKLDKLKHIIQVGIRDFCKEEYELAQNERITTHYDDRLHMVRDRGDLWDNTCNYISCDINPTFNNDNVWISIDVDGLDPKLCPNTGTPVPGGIDFWQLITLCKTVARYHRIIGVDIVEVAPDNKGYKWPNVIQHGDGYDEIVGSRILYKLAAYALASQDPTLWWAGDSS